MKRLTLIKHHTNPVTAHIYEHLFCYALERYLIDKQLIFSLDYAYEARTYRSGLIYVTIDLFTEQAEAAGDFVSDVKVSFEESSVSTAIFEIMAEKQIAIDGDYTKLVHELKQLHGSAWQDINRIGTIDMASVRRSFSSADEFEVNAAAFRTLTVSLSVDQAKANRPRAVVAPVFDIIASVIMNNISDMLAREYGYHGVEANTPLYKASSTAMKRKFRIHKRCAPSLTTEIDDCRNLIEYFVKHGLIEKIRSYLATASYDVPLRAPDELRLYEESGLVVGAEGWKILADSELIHTIMSSIDITFSHGSKRQTIRLIPVQ